MPTDALNGQLPAAAPSERKPRGSDIVRLTSPDDGLPEHFRRVVSFHPRGGRLNPVQRAAWNASAERWVVEASPEFSPRAIFGRKAPLIIEIGSGMGEATAGMASRRPDVNLLAVEVYKPGVAQTLYHLAKAGAENVRIVRADAVDVLTTMIRPASLDEAWVFFPDPWPKTRHLKRRLVNAEFAGLVASRLAHSGVLRMATDWEAYALQMLAVLNNEPKLRNRHSGWAPRPEFRPRTRFERRGLADGREIFDLEFERR
jgi:tRNA (guanine-N7-)-methyltransferase